MKKSIAVFLCVLSLAGCGKRGRLEFPDGATYPRQYPAARSPVFTDKRNVPPPVVAQDKDVDGILEINQIMETEK